MRYRTLQGLKQRDSGRFFNPSELSKMERILLRNSFRPIQDLQSLLKTRFQLGFF
jgi:CBS domain-containing protein